VALALKTTGLTSAMVKKSFNPILDPDAKMDHHQNLMTCKLTSNLPRKYQPNPPVAFGAILLTNQPTDKYQYQV